MTTREPEFFSRYLPSFSSADLASLRSEKSSKSKKASSSASRSALVSTGGGASSCAGGAGAWVSVSGGLTFASGVILFRLEQPGARASTTQSPSTVARVRRISYLPSSSGDWTTTTSKFVPSTAGADRQPSPARLGPYVHRPQAGMPAPLIRPEDAALARLSHRPP